jgi:hypothetical protein
MVYYMDKVDKVKSKPFLQEIIVCKDGKLETTYDPEDIKLWLAINSGKVKR